MNIQILTPDSIKPNLAAMKISAWHKANGDSVDSFSLSPADFKYASVLFKWTTLPHADVIGGPRFPQSRLDPEVERMKPDYDFYPKLDYSLGYTYRACPRTCDFCVVPEQKNSEDHYSIWDFHNPRFKKICLLNNNTLADLQWRETFNEIIDAKLTIVDENGYDARLITEEVAKYIKKIRFDSCIHTAWDFMEHEKEVLAGLNNLINAGVKKIACYVLIGYGTTVEEDLYRVMTLRNLGIDPFVMPFDRDNYYQRHFARWVNHKAVFKTVTFQEYMKGR